MPHIPTWLIPALTAILPHVGDIISAAAPVFTKKHADATANQSMVLQQQITELQTAVSRNDTHIKELAEQIQRTVTALETGASIAERTHRWMLSLCIAAMVLSALSLGLMLFILTAR